jgi:hypothetical protein
VNVVKGSVVETNVSIAYIDRTNDIISFDKTNSVVGTSVD